MTEVADRFGRVGNRFTQLLSQCPQDSWNAPSPCEGWSASQVARHLLGTTAKVASRVGGDVAYDEEDSLPATRTAWSKILGATTARLADPLLSQAGTTGMFGEMTFEELVAFLLCTEVLVHSWDFARATGQEATIDGEACAHALSSMAPMDAALRVPGGFGPKIEPAPGASVQTRLLNFLGRTA